MLIIVIEKPIQFTIVNDEPLYAGTADCATKVENNGESAMTTILQKNRKAMNINGEAPYKNRGDNKQQHPESAKAVVAIFFAPNRLEIRPLNIHENPPAAIIKKDKRGILKFRFGWRLL